MYSQCPDCLARFRVTAVQLRAAHGTVRCGRCGAAFDALSRLSDALPQTDPVADEAKLLAGVDEIAAAAESGVPAEYHFSAADLEKVFIEARDWSPPRATTPSFEADGETGRVIVVEPEQIEDITLEGERVAIDAVGADVDAEDEDTDSFRAEMLGEDGNAETPLDFDLTGDVEILDDEDATNRLRALRVQAEAPPTSAAPAATPVSPRVAATVGDEDPDNPPPARDWPLPSPRARAPVASAATGSVAERWSPPGGLDDELDDDVEGDESRRRARLWTMGSCVLAILLLVQIVHHYRDRLARQSGIGAVVRSIYDGLDMPLGNAWDLDAFELRQWGNGSDLGAGRLNVRASLTNRAMFPQPLPLLRVEIEDRFGEAVAIRDFKPSEYLKDQGRVGRLLASGESADAQLDVVAAGLEGVGYRLNVCMRDSDGAVHCAAAPG
jgi:predicted Zn finger-like uncharacterized protein